MAKWNVTLANKASSRTELRTVDADSRAHAILVAIKTFSGPDQWAFVTAAEVPDGYYERIARWTNNLDAEIEDREERMERQRESFAAYNED